MIHISASMLQNINWSDLSSHISLQILHCTVCLNRHDFDPGNWHILSKNTVRPSSLFLLSLNLNFCRLLFIWGSGIRWHTSHAPTTHWCLACISTQSSLNILLAFPDFPQQSLDGSNKPNKVSYCMLEMGDDMIHKELITGNNDRLKKVKGRREDA